MNTYRLTKTELKNGKFLYEVKDENNNTISKRASTRGLCRYRVLPHQLASSTSGQAKYFAYKKLPNFGEYEQ